MPYTGSPSKPSCEPVRTQFSSPGPAAGSQPFQQLSNAGLLLIDEANPVYASPKAWNLPGALEKIPYIASFTGFVDDTSAYADLILPDHSFLESWVDMTAESGTLEAVTTSAAPVMRPIHDTRATADVLIAIAGKLKDPIALPWKSAEELAKSSPPAASPRAPEGRQVSSAAAARAGTTYTEPLFDGAANDYPLHFLPYASAAFGDGSTAHLPWLQELPDPLTSAMWSSWLEINPQTAAKLGVADGDLVDVTSTQGSLRVPAVLFPGIAPDLVAMPIGQGHQHFTRYASQRGASAVSLLAPITDRETGSLAWAATRVKVARAGDPDGSLILFAGEKYENRHDRERR